MLTIFTTAKAFRGHNGIIQRNAIESWLLLHPKVEVILFGDDEGSSEIAQELGLRHAPALRKNETNGILIGDMFAQAQAMATYDVLCYSNCDIILLDDFWNAQMRVRAAHKTFLMIGRRWDTDIIEPIDYMLPGAKEQLIRRAKEQGFQRGPDAVDYFVFTRGLYADLPEFVIGRLWWDHWLVWKAMDSKHPVIDVSPVVTAIHQNHDYTHHPKGWKGIWEGAEPKRNLELAGGKSNLRTLDDVTHIMSEGGEKRHFWRWWAPYGRYLRPKVMPVWFGILGVTRPVRKMLGLRTKPSIPRTGEMKG
jgi:hypothetical protein